MIQAERTTDSYARGRGLSRSLYAVVRALTLVLRTWFRSRVSGSDQISDDGGVIVDPNHKNFLDPFFIGIATRRPVRFMAKVELFKGPLAWLLTGPGVFPVRRGQTDAKSIDTATAILRAGGLVVMFPEGTRVEQPDALGAPVTAPAAWRSRPARRSFRRQSRGRRICAAARSDGSKSHFSPGGADTGVGRRDSARSSSTGVPRPRCGRSTPGWPPDRD